MKSLLKLIRPKHWVKNIFIFMPIFFGGALTDTTALTASIMAFFAYSFAASSIYCYNDIIDVEQDRRHSVKCHRPIASGAVSILQGYLIMAFMLLLSAAMVLLSGTRFMHLGAVILAYYVLDLAYCRLLKHFAIVDVVILSFGFVLRILAGSAATGIVASQWLVLMTFLLTLLLGFAKRRDDVLRMQRTGIPPRHNTKRYNLTFINQAVTVTAAVTLVCYIMYTMSYTTPQTSTTSYITTGTSSYAYLTTIFVLLGLLRYMQIAAVDENTGDPTKLMFQDRFLQIVILLWFIAFALIIYL